MAEKWPVIIDNRGDNTVLYALQRFLTNLQTVTIGTGGPLGSNLLHALKIPLENGWATLRSDTSRPFDRPKSGRIAVKVINHLGGEVMKVFRVEADKP